jgi:hypothetical protein
MLSKPGCSLKKVNTVSMPDCGPAIVPFIPSAANNQVPLTSTLVILFDNGSRNASKASKRTNLYNAQIVIADGVCDIADVDTFFSDELIVSPLN